MFLRFKGRDGGIVGAVAAASAFALDVTFDWLFLGGIVPKRRGVATTASLLQPEAPTKKLCDT